MTTPLTKMIKKALVEKGGYSPKAISVRHSWAGYSEAYKITIDDYIDNKLVASILAPFKDIARDEVTGEILEGGNTYIFYQESERVTNLRREKARKFWNSLNEALSAVGCVFQGYRTSRPMRPDGSRSYYIEAEIISGDLEAARRALKPFQGDNCCIEVKLIA